MSRVTQLPISLADLTHVVRSPLTVMKTQLAMSKTQIRKNNLEDLSETFNSQINLLTNLMDDISFMSAYQQNEVNRGSDSVDVNQAVCEAWSEFINVHQDIDCKINIIQESRQTIKADPRHIKLMIIRMLEASVLDGATELEIIIGSDFILVKDNGQGTKISNFSEINSTPKHSRRASIGLSVVKIIAEMYNYNLSVEFTLDGSALVLRRL